jgi:hypothetical protein
LGIGISHGTSQMDSNNNATKSLTFQTLR